MANLGDDFPCAVSYSSAVWSTRSEFVTVMGDRVKRSSTQVWRRLTGPFETRVQVTLVVCVVVIRLC